MLRCNMIMLGTSATIGSRTPANPRIFRITITVTQADIDAERAEASKEYAKGRSRVAAPDTYGDNHLEILAPCTAKSQKT